MENYSKIYNQFVPYNLSVKLKELGFDEPCLHYFNKQENNQLWQDLDSGYYRNSIVSEGNLLWGDTYDNGNVSAPLWQQAFDWFRKEGVISWIDRNDNTFRYNIEFSNGSILGLQGFVTYEEARLACLEKLI